MKTIWNKLPTVKQFKDLAIYDPFVLKEQFDDEANYCDVYIKLNNNNKDNCLYIDSLVYKNFCAKDAEVIPVFIEQVQLEVKE